MLECDLEVSEFELQSRWFSHFRTLIQRKIWTPLYRPVGLVVECSPMARKTRVQSPVESYQRLKKWYLIFPCLNLSIIRCISRVKWSNPGKGVAPSSTPQCSSCWKGSIPVTLDYGRQLYFYFLYPSLL